MFWKLLDTMGLTSLADQTRVPECLEQSSAGISSIVCQHDASVIMQVSGEW